MTFDYDRFLVDQLVRPIANLYRVTPLALARRLPSRDQYVLDLSGDREKKFGRCRAIALAVGLETLQNR